MKVKIFRFAASPFASEIGDPKVDDLSDEEDIINNFIKDKEVIDIRVNTIDVQYRSNTKCNTIHLVYTILYN